jgi:hypothetical protein
MVFNLGLEAKVKAQETPAVTIVAAGIKEATGVGTSRVRREVVFSNCRTRVLEPWEYGGSFGSVLFKERCFKVKITIKIRRSRFTTNRQEVNLLSA